MLHLNTIFQAERLDPNLVNLVRHKDKRFQEEEKSVFDVWYSERFEKYQSVQRQRNKFDVGEIVVSFVDFQFGRNLVCWIISCAISTTVDH